MSGVGKEKLGEHASLLRLLGEREPGQKRERLRPQLEGAQAPGRGDCRRTEQAQHGSIIRRSCARAFALLGGRTLAPSRREEHAMTTQEITRRDLLRKGLTGTALGAAALALPGIARAEGPESVQVAKIYQLQAAFHRAKTTQDL